MMKLAAFFIVVSVIGATNGYRFIPKIDFDKTEQAHVDKLEVKATLIQNELAMLDQLVANNNTENNATSAIEAFKSKLNFLSEFFEDVVAKFSKMEKFELSEDICNVQEVRNNVSLISNVIYDCAMKQYNTLLKSKIDEVKIQLNDIHRESLLNLREALQQGEEKIRKCRNIDKQDAINAEPKRYVQCIREEYSSSDNTLDSFNKVLQNINETVHGIPTAATILKNCKAVSSAKIIMEAIQDVTTCLSKNVLGLEDAVEEDIPKTKLQAIKEKVVPAISKISNSIKEMIRKYKEEDNQFKENLNGIWNVLTG